MQVGIKNRSFRPISRFISEMIQDMVIVTVERQYELACMVPFPLTLSDPSNIDLKVVILFNVK